MAETQNNSGDAETLARLRAMRGFIFDMDGTLVLGNHRNKSLNPLPGAVELLELLRQRGIPFAVFTNGTPRTPQKYAETLRAAGLPITDDEMMTPSSVAAEVFAGCGYRRILVLGCEGVWRPVADVGIEVVLPADMVDGAAPVDAVYVGWYREFTMDDLETACRAVWAGAKLYSASNVPFFATADGKAFGTSFAIVAMIKALTGIDAIVVGKPSPEALEAAGTRLGLAPADFAVVGDDPLLEPRMARAGGALAVAVTSGFNDEASFLEQAPEHRADLIFPGVDKLLSAYRNGA